MRSEGARRIPMQGFTLIELIVVIALIGLLLFFTIPRFERSVPANDARAASRWLINRVKELKYTAVRDQKQYLLHMDTGSGKLWITHGAMTEEDAGKSSENAYRLPESIRITDVSYPGGERIGAGEALIRFYPAGHSDKAMIHIRDGDDTPLSLLVEPFLPSVRVYEGYVDIPS